MEKLVCLMGVGLTKIILIKLLDLGIVVRLTESKALILAVKSLSSLFLVGIENIVILIGHKAGTDDRLTAACYTTAGTTHDLDEVILALACANIIKQNLCILHTVCNSNVNSHTVDIDGSLTDSLKASDGLKLNSLVLFAGKNKVYCTKSCLHNTAGNAEDNACAGVIAHKILIEVLIGETVKDYTCTLDHSCKLTGGKNRINVLKTVDLKLIALLLILLCGTRHNGNNKDILGINVILLSIIALDQSALHLMGALAAGKVGQKITVVILCVVDPSGRAGGDHRKNTAVFDPAEKLCSLFHNGEVSGKVGVINLIEAETSECCNHLTCYCGTNGHTEFLAQSGTYCGSSLNNNVHSGLHSSIDLIDLALLHQSAGGAHAYALSALDTGRINEAAVLGGRNDGVKAAVFKAEDSHTVCILATCNATSAKDTLGGITNNRGRKLVQSYSGLGAYKAILAGTGNVSNVKKLALAVLVALLAVLIVIGKKKLNGSTASLACLGAGNDDLHTLVYGIYAGSNEASCALNLNKAYTARAVGALTMVESTKRGYLVSAFFSRFQNCQALFDLIGNAFYFNIYHFTFLLIIS